MDGDGCGTWRYHREIDEPGLRASIVAEVTAAVSGGGAASSARGVHVSQRRSARTDESWQEKERTVSAQPGLSPEELDAASAEQLPDREQMSLINANVAVPVNAAVAANVLSDESTAGAGADQTGDIGQANLP